MTLVLSLLIIRSFFIQFDPLVVVVGTDSFTRSQQFIVDDTLLIPPNAHHHLQSEVRFGLADIVDCWLGSIHDFLHLGFSKYIYYSLPVTMRYGNVFLFCLESKISCVFALLHLPIVQFMQHLFFDPLSLFHGTYEHGNGWLNNTQLPVKHFFLIGYHPHPKEPLQLMAIDCKNN